MPRRIYMYFFLRRGWQVQFLEEDLKTALPKRFTFASADKVRALIERAGGFMNLETRQAFEHGLENGRGGVYLKLTDGQYAKLIGR